MRHSGVVLMLGLCFSSAATALEPVNLTAGPDPVSLAGHIEELYDPTGEWTLEDVRKPEIAARFVTAQRATINHGLSDDIYWYRLVLRAPAAPMNVRQDWVFSLGIPTLDHVDIHVSRADGKTETTLTGDLRPAPANLLSSPTFTIPLGMTPGEEVTIHVRVQTVGRHQILLWIGSQATFLDAATRDSYMAGAVLGIMLVMAVYNLLIYVVIRDRAYAYYVLFILSMLVGMALLHGEARLWGNALFPGALWWINATAAPLAGLVALPMTLFFREFMQTRVHVPRVHTLTTGLVLLAAGTILLYPLIGFLATTRLTFLVFLINAVAMVAVGVYLAARGVRAAWFILGAWIVLILALAVWIASAFGALPTLMAVLWAPPTSICVAVTLLSLALADRLNLERRERERFARLKSFFAPQVAEAILEEGGVSLLAPKRREVTVIFTDLRGFTALAAQSEPEELIKVLREYHEVVVEATAKHGGNVEHFAGDGVMIYFNAPVEVSEPEVRAVRLAFELKEKFEGLCQMWRKRGHELGVGIGMASGYATVGAIGAKERMGYSCIGTVTNLAARLCAQAGHGQILAPQLFINRVEPLVVAESQGERELKGMNKPVAVYNLTGLKVA